VIVPPHRGVIASKRRPVLLFETLVRYPWYHCAIGNMSVSNVRLPDALFNRAYGVYNITLDNGPALKANVSKRLHDAGHVVWPDDQGRAHVISGQAGLRSVACACCSSFLLTQTHIIEPLMYYICMPVGRSVRSVHVAPRRLHLHRPEEH
jgi:hypothetical protein